MNYYFLEVEPDDRVVQQYQVSWDGEGQPAPPEPMAGNSCIAIEAPISFQQSSSTRIPYWQNGALVWIETATLDDLKAAKSAEINGDREIANTSFTYAGKTIRRLPLDESDINGTNGYVSLFGTFPDNWPGGWKAADNSYVAIATTDDWKAFYKAMVDTGTANFNHSQDLKAQLAAATTPEQVAAIVW